MRDELESLGVGPGIQPPGVLVAGGEGQLLAHGRPLQGQYVLGEACVAEFGRGLLHAPDLDGSVLTGTGQDVGGRGVEVEQADLLGVARERGERRVDLFRDSRVRQAPEADQGVVAACGDLVLVEGVELEVRYGAPVALDPGVRGWNAAQLVLEREGCENAGTCGFPTEGNVFAVRNH